MAGLKFGDEKLFLPNTLALMKSVSHVSPIYSIILEIFSLMNGKLEARIWKFGLVKKVQVILFEVDLPRMGKVIQVHGSGQVADMKQQGQESSHA